MRNLADGIAEFVRAHEARGSKPERLEEARLSFEKASAHAQPAQLAQLTIVNWYVAASGREIPVRLYRPQGEGPFATLLYFHGGGWVVGSPDSHDRITAEIALRAGVQVVSVHYRRAPENPHPAAVEDGLEVLKWALRDGDLHGIDSRRIGVAGDSAGGHIAAALTQRARSEWPEGSLRCQVLLYPALDPDFTTASYMENAEAPMLTTADMRKFWQLYMPFDDHGDPVAFPARAQDKQGLPPALIVGAQYDPLRDDGPNYARTLMEAGVEVEVRIVPGMVHSFLRALDYSAPARAELDHVCARLRHDLRDRPLVKDGDKA